MSCILFSCPVSPVCFAFQGLFCIYFGCFLYLFSFLMLSPPASCILRQFFMLGLNIWDLLHFRLQHAFCSVTCLPVCLTNCQEKEVSPHIFFPQQKNITLDCAAIFKDLSASAVKLNELSRGQTLLVWSKRSQTQFCYPLQAHSWATRERLDLDVFCAQKQRAGLG